MFWIGGEVEDDGLIVGECYRDFYNLGTVEMDGSNTGVTSLKTIIFC